MRRRMLQPYREIVEDLGAKILKITITGSTHYKVEIEARGRRRVFVASSSPSDHRAILNWKCDVRRWINNLER
jgi:hypothetical protein